MTSVFFRLGALGGEAFFLIGFDTGFLRRLGDGGLFLGLPLKFGFLTRLLLGFGFEAEFLLGLGLSLRFFVRNAASFGQGADAGLVLRFGGRLRRPGRDGRCIGAAPLDGFHEDALADNSISAARQHHDADVVGGEFRRHAWIVIKILDPKGDSAVPGADGHGVRPEPSGRLGLLFVGDDGRQARGWAAGAIINKIHRQGDFGAVLRLLEDAQIADAGAAHVLVLGLDEDGLGVKRADQLKGEQPDAAAFQRFHGRILSGKI